MTAGDDPVRLFIAVPLPAEIKVGVEALCSGLKSKVPRGSWVKPEAMHITLRFLGDTDPDRVPEIERILRETAAATAPILVRFVGGGGFPSRRNPRVLWVGMEDHGGLPGLAIQLEHALTTAGFAPADKPFRAHLTLCRMRDCTRGVPAELVEAGEIGQFTADHVVLFRSELLLSGAVHTPVADVPLTGSTP